MPASRCLNKGPNYEDDYFEKGRALLPGLLPGDNKYTRGLCELVVGDPIYAARVCLP